MTNKTDIELFLEKAMSRCETAEDLNKMYNERFLDYFDKVKERLSLMYSNKLAELNGSKE